MRKEKKMAKATMVSTDFNRIISAVKKFADTSTNRIYRFVRLEFSATDSRVTAVAVDGFRVSVEHAMCSDCDEDFCYVYKDIKFPKDLPISFDLCDGECAVKCGGMAFVYEQPDGIFLDWQKVIPNKEPTFRIGFNANYLLDALQSAKVSVGGVFKNPVVLEFTSPLEPVVIRTNKDDVKIVLPIRLKQDC